MVRAWHTTSSSQRSSARAATPAASCCGCCSGHPELESGPWPRATQRRPRRSPSCTRTCRRWPTGPSCRPTPAVLAERRPGLPRPAARASRPRSSPQLPRRRCSSSTCGADFRLADAGAWERLLRRRRTPAPGPTGCPSCPAPARALAGATPGRQPRAATRPRSSLALAPLLAAGLVEPADVVVVAASGTSGAGRAAKPTRCSASEVMGALSRVQGRRRPPAHPGDGAGARRLPPATPVTLSFTPMLAPMPRGILATCTARLAAGRRPTERCARRCTAAYDDEPFVHVLPDGQWPHDRRRRSARNAVHLQVAADDARGPGRRGRPRSTTSARAPPARRVQNANLALGLPETAGLTAIGVAP